MRWTNPIPARGTSLDRSTGFAYFASGKLELLVKCSTAVVRPFLPSLIRLYNASSQKAIDNDRFPADLLAVQTWLLQSSEAGALNTMWSHLDFKILAHDLTQDLALKKKNLSAGIYKLEPAPVGAGSRFEMEEPMNRFRFVLSEFLYIMLLEAEEKPLPPVRDFEIADNAAYLSELCDIVVIAVFELSALISLPKLCVALLRYRSASKLIQQILCNFPDKIFSVLKALLENSEPQDEDGTAIASQRSSVLVAVAALDASYASYIQQFCIEHLRMPGLLIRLTLQPPQMTGLAETVSALTCVMQGADSNARVWMNNHILNAQRVGASNTSVSLLRSALFKWIDDANGGRSGDRFLANDDAIVRSMSLIKLYALMRVAGNIKMNDSEVHAAVDLLTSRFDLARSGQCGSQYICQGLVTLCACQKMLGVPGTESGAELETMVVSWLRWLMTLLPSKDAIEVDSVGGNDAENSSIDRRFENLLLLMALYFHGAQYPFLTTLVSSVLGMKVQIRATNIVKLRSIFVTDIFPESVIAERAVCVPVTPRLSSLTGGHLPVHCVHQLLQSRIFTKHKVSIKDWVVSQLAQCALPVHPVVRSLLESFVTSCLNPITGTAGTANWDLVNTPIDPESIVEAMDSDPTDQNTITYRVLLMYYVLFYEESWLNRIKAMGSIGGSDVGADGTRAETASNYPPTMNSHVHDSMPVRYLMDHVIQHSDQYASIYPHLQRLVTSQYQYLFLIQEPLSCAAAPGDRSWPAELAARTRQLRLAMAPEKFAEALTTRPSTSADDSWLLPMLYIQTVHSLPIGAKLPYIPALVRAIPALLEVGVPLRVLGALVAVWEQLETVVPRKLYCATVSELLMSDPPPHFLLLPGQKLSLCHQDLSNDPLMVLRCDRRVFRCLPILEIVLRILSCYLLASRMELHRLLACKPGAGTGGGFRVGFEPTGSAKSPEAADREELVNALIGAQESAAVQILLEACLPREDEKNQSLQLFSKLREVQSLICSHLHQVFINDPSLTKLVHFQGYPLELLPLAVAGIPSMHICLDFIPELFQQADQAKQVFGFVLLSYLCEQYTIPKALSIARLGVSVMNTQLAAVTSLHMVAVFRLTLPAFFRISRIFPPLTSEITSILYQVANILMARLSIPGNRAPVNADDMKYLGQVPPTLSSGVSSLSGVHASSTPMQDESAVLLREIVQGFQTSMPKTVSATDGD